MILSLRSRLAAAGHDRLALLFVGLGFVFLALSSVVGGGGPLGFVGLFVRPILAPLGGGPSMTALLPDLMFAFALILAAVSGLRRTLRAWGSPALQAGTSVPLGASWRERAARAAAVLGERRGGNGNGAGPESTATTPDMILLGVGTLAGSTTEETDGELPAEPETVPDEPAAGPAGWARPAPTPDLGGWARPASTAALHQDFDEESDDDDEDFEDDEEDDGEEPS